jgi:hypothetical protein
MLASVEDREAVESSILQAGGAYMGLGVDVSKVSADEVRRGELSGVGAGGEIRQGAGNHGDEDGSRSGVKPRSRE